MSVSIPQFSFNPQGRMFNPYFVDDKGIDPNFMEIYKNRLGKLNVSTGGINLKSFMKLFDDFGR